ncbi:hypothetical protein [Nannocystis pusilla]
MIDRISAGKSTRAASSPRGFRPEALAPTRAIAVAPRSRMGACSELQV